MPDAATRRNKYFSGVLTIRILIRDHHPYAREENMQKANPELVESLTSS
jgi:hypothetical protein